MANGFDISTVHYRVKRVTYSRRQCRVCGGTGKRNSRSGSDEKCLNCLNGVENIEHQTEVDMKIALEEMGIRKLIENTAKEILASPQPPPKEGT